VPSYAFLQASSIINLKNKHTGSSGVLIVVKLSSDFYISFIKNKIYTLSSVISDGTESIVKPIEIIIC
jgi:hypothetical protein